MEEEENNWINDDNGGEMDGGEDDDVEILDDEEAELHFSVEGLGQFHEIDTQRLFVKTDECLDCILDIQRSLRKHAGENGENANSRQMEKFLGRWKTVQNQLLPLILHYREDTKILIGVLKLLVVLTRPISRQTPDFALHLQFLQDYKDALCCKDLFIVLMSVLMDVVQSNEGLEDKIKELEESIYTDKVSLSAQNPADTAVTDEDKKAKKAVRDEKKSQLRRLKAIEEQNSRHVELSLSLIRHLLEIPDPRDGDPGYTLHRANLQIQILQKMNEESVLDLLILFAEQVDVGKYKKMNWLFFEIFYHICAKLDPVEIAANADQYKVDLSKLLELEKKIVYADLPMQSRHSRFAPPSVISRAVDFSGGAATTTTTTTAAAGRQVVLQKEARSRHYREKVDEEKQNIFQDQTFMDITTGRGGGSTMFPSSVVGATRREFVADIKRFVDQFIDTVFTGLMESIYKELQSGSNNIHPYDTVRVLNMIAWILDYQRTVIKTEREKNKKIGNLFDDAGDVKATDLVRWALSEDAVSLVISQVRIHSKDSKGIKQGGANLMVAIRTALQQLRIVSTLGPVGRTFTVCDMFKDDDLHGLLQWTIRNFKPTVNRPELLSFAVECLETLLKVYALFQPKGEKEVEGKSKKSKKKESKKKISREEAEMAGQEFYEYNSGSSDYAPSVDSDDYYGNGGGRGSGVTVERVVDDMCHGEVTKMLFFLLSNFKDNTRRTNAALAALLFRIITAKDCYVAFFFQLPYLVTIYNIVNDGELRVSPESQAEIVLICKLIIHRFIETAKKNKNIFVEVLFPKSKNISQGHLLTIEADLEGICSNYSNNEMRDILEQLNEGDSYEELREKAKEKSSGFTPWVEDEEQQLIGLWGHWNEVKGKSLREKIEAIVANLPPSRKTALPEGGNGGHKTKRRTYKDVRHRLIKLNLISDGDVSEDSDIDDYFGSSDGGGRDDDQNESRNRRSGGGRSESEKRSETSSEDEDDPMDVEEYLRRANAGGVKGTAESMNGGLTESLVTTFETLLKRDVGLDKDDWKLLGFDAAVFGG